MLALVDREGEPPLAKQFRHIAVRCVLVAAAQRNGQPPGIELGVAAQGSVTGQIGDQQPDRSVARNLQSEDAVILQRGRERDAKHHRFGERPRHGERIAVALDHFVQDGREAHQAAAHT